MACCSRVSYLLTKLFTRTTSGARRSGYACQVSQLFLGVMVLPVMNSVALADNKLYHVGVDKVYDPYVQPLERELELRGAYQFDHGDEKQGVYVQHLGAGAAVSDTIFVEAYLIGKQTPERDFLLEAYELEAKVQLTEQGEYAADWGLLFEFEKSRNQSIYEWATTVLVEKEWRRWVGRANLKFEYEYGEDVVSELDYGLSVQLRYRYSRFFEPAIEIYADEFTRAIGPVAMGEYRFGVKQKVLWELGLLLGQNSETADHTLKATLEYEF